MIDINPKEIEASELQTLLFETCTIFKDKEAYTALNEKAKTLYDFSQYILRDETL